MKNEYIDELNALIPSEYVRNYVLEMGWVFTDEQKAVLLVHGDLSLQEQCSRLQALQKNTADRSLKERIAKYLNGEDLKLQAFKENSDKTCIYILEVKKKITHIRAYCPMNISLISIWLMDADGKQTCLS